jgi:2-polyprenyl-3-methyl-5-hydroxy-6-metoxy-1,4-benzoquinol methylase
MTATNDAYIYSQSWEQERARLSGLSAQFDTVTVRHLTALGVAPGWHCLEIGAGGGSIARRLAETVGPDGRVVATDLDTRFLTDLPANVEVKRHDLVADPLPADTYDLIHARAVLEHIPARRAVIAGLVPALKPGGLLVLEDVVFGESLRSANERVFAPHAKVALHLRTLMAVAAGFRAIGADSEFGLELPDALEAAGLRDVDAELTARIVRGGSPQAAFYELSLRELGDRLVGAGLLTADDVTESLASLVDPASRWLSLGLVTAWGRRPER